MAYMSVVAHNDKMLHLARSPGFRAWATFFGEWIIVSRRHLMNNNSATFLYPSVSHNLFLNSRVTFLKIYIYIYVIPSDEVAALIIDFNPIFLKLTHSLLSYHFH